MLFLQWSLEHALQVLLALSLSSLLLLQDHQNIKFLTFAIIVFVQWQYDIILSYACVKSAVILMKINRLQKDWLLPTLWNLFHLPQFVRCCLEMKWEHHIAFGTQTDTPLCVVVEQVKLIQLQSASFCSNKWLAVPTAAKWGSAHCLSLIDASCGSETS